MGTILIQIVFYQILFLALYEVLLKRDTHYNLQRFYLLFLPVLALFLPYLVIPALSKGIVETYQLSMPAILLGDVSNGELVNTSTTRTVGNSYSVLFIIWAVGAGVSSLWFLWKYLSLLKLRATASLVDNGNYKLASLPNTDVAFSFGNTIYLGEALEEEAKEVILKHEKVHVAQKHSMDLILYQLLRIVFWWNPVIYLFQNRLEAVHEYIADAEVVAHIAKKEYYQNLLSQVFKTNGISFTNTFYKQSLIKKRIIMLQKIKSPRKSKFKYLLVFPLLAFMLVIVSCASHIAKNDKLKETEVVEMVDDVPFAVVDKVPVYPECEGNNEELRNCMNQKINELVASHFNTSLGKELGLEGVQSIMTMFTIDKSGNISDINVRAPHKELEKEARRVLDLLPQFIPGEQKGNKVGVTFTLPIRFTVASEK